MRLRFRVSSFGWGSYKSLSHFLYAACVRVGTGFEVNHKFVLPGMTNDDEGSKAEEL